MPVKYNCKKYKQINPFIEIGEYYIKLRNEEFVNNIEDQIFRYYANNKLNLKTYLSDICKVILPKIE